MYEIIAKLVYDKVKNYRCIKKEYSGTECTAVQHSQEFRQKCGKYKYPYLNLSRYSMYCTVLYSEEWFSSSDFVFSILPHLIFWKILKKITEQSDTRWKITMNLTIFFNIWHNTMGTLGVQSPCWLAQRGVLQGYVQFVFSSPEAPFIVNLIAML